MTQFQMKIDRLIPPSKSACKNPPAGFSLVELLVVIAILASVTSVAIIAFNNPGKGPAVQGAVDLAASMANQARLEAMRHGIGSKLVIDAGDDPAYRFRRMAVVRLEGNDPNNPTEVLAGRPMTLPQNVYFATEDLTATYASNNGDLPLQQIALQGTHTTPCIVYEFNGSGHLENPGTMVFVGGIENPDGSILVTQNHLAGVLGFRLPVNGRPAFFNSKEQIASLNPETSP